jgi:hypothetical protein
MIVRISLFTPSERLAMSEPRFDQANLNRGVRLRFPLRDGDGKLLLAQGVEVTDRLLRVLQSRGISLRVLAYLKVASGVHKGLEIPINKPILTIGRRPDNDVQVADQKISGYHCNIFRRGLDLILEDIVSMNGTMLNGARLTKATELSDQDTIRVGPTQFTIHIHGAVAADNAEGSEALRAWVVSESSGVLTRHKLFTPTEPFIDLDAPR